MFFDALQGGIVTEIFVGALENACICSESVVYSIPYEVTVAVKPHFLPGHRHRIRKKGLTVKSGHRLTAWISSAREDLGFGLVGLTTFREAACFVLPGHVVRSFPMPSNANFW